MSVAMSSKSMSMKAKPLKMEILSLRGQFYRADF